MEYAEIIETPNMHPLQKEFVGQCVRILNRIDGRKVRYLTDLGISYTNGTDVTFTTNQLREITKEEFLDKNYDKRLKPGDIVRCIRLPNGTISTIWRERFGAHDTTHFHWECICGGPLRVSYINTNKKFVIVQKYEHRRHTFTISPIDDPKVFVIYDEAVLRPIAERSDAYEE